MNDWIGSVLEVPWVESSYIPLLIVIESAPKTGQIRIRKVCMIVDQLSYAPYLVFVQVS